MIHFRTITLPAILAASFAAASCSSDAEKAMEKEKVGVNTAVFDEQKFKQRFHCPSEEPSDLTSRILALEGKTPEGLQNALARSSDQDKFHLLRSSGDETAATALLSEIYRRVGIECRGYVPTRQDLYYRANQFLDSEWKDSWDKAFDLFGQLGFRGGQLAVAQKYETAALESRSAYDTNDNFKRAVKLYQQLGDTTASQRIARSIFVRSGSLDYSLKLMKDIGVQPDAEFFIARGDYQMSEAGKDQSWLAGESYIHSGNRNKVAEFMGKAQEKAREDVSWYTQARKAAEFLGDQAHAHMYAEFEFITLRSTVPTKDETETWTRVGLIPTPDLYTQRGNYHLGKGVFWAAFDAYKVAGNEDGMNRAVVGMLTPLPPQDSE